jgi:transposase
MVELKKEGKSIKEIARIFEVSPRTVQRWLKAVAGRESKVGQVADEMVQGGCRIAK